MAEIQGIDISRHQGRVDWDAIQRDCNFVILRAGYGGGGVDEQFPRNRDEARNRGIPRQFYFYAYPGRSSGRAQAEEFFQRTGALKAGESISLDIEDDPVFGRNLVPSDVQWCLDFLNRCKELFGVKPLIYMNSSTLSRFDWTPVKNGDFGLWVANYGANDGQPHSRPSSGVWPFWALWQYTSRGNKGGVSPVDVNIFSGDKAAFLKYGLAGAAPTPSPKPQPVPPAHTRPATRYTVQKNDTLSAIAARHGTSWQALYAANKSVIGSNPNLIKAGQVLVIPNGANPVPVQPNRPVNYIVVGGDTLGKISARFGASVDQMVSWNKPKYPSITRNYIQAGWSIRVK